MSVRVVDRLRPDLPEEAARHALGLFCSSLAEEALDVMREVAPRDTGNLAASFRIRKRSPTDYVIESDTEYAEYVLTGTGLHGPRRRVIRPRRARALRFEADGEIVFARYVRGQRPQNFAAETVERVEHRITPLMEEAAARTRRRYG